MNQQMIKIIVQARNAKGLTQKDMAKLLNVSRSTMANTETGRQKMYMCRFFQICEILDLKWSDFGELTSQEPDYMNTVRILLDSVKEKMKGVNERVDIISKLLKGGL